MIATGGNMVDSSIIMILLSTTNLFGAGKANFVEKRLVVLQLIK